MPCIHGSANFALLHPIDLGPDLDACAKIFLRLQVASLFITICEQDGFKTSFKIRPSTPIGKLRKAFLSQLASRMPYCNRDPSAYVLMYEGVGLKDTQTAEELDMMDGDFSDVMERRVGD